jgi:hypothetical protein
MIHRPITQNDNPTIMDTLELTFQNDEGYFYNYLNGIFLN